MNHSLPPGDRGLRGGNPRGAPGSGRAVPGSDGLVWRTAAVATKLRIGRRRATVGPRSFGPRFLGVWDQGSGNLAGDGNNRGQT
jgi:hypothetical protein